MPPRNPEPAVAGKYDHLGWEARWAMLDYDERHAELHAAREQTEDSDMRGYAQIVVDEYERALDEHAETPDLAGPPALLDIIDAQATVAGVQADDAALIAAVQAEFARRGLEMPSLAYES